MYAVSVGTSDAWFDMILERCESNQGLGPLLERQESSSARPVMDLHRYIGPEGRGA